VLSQSHNQIQFKVIKNFIDIIILLKKIITGKIGRDREGLGNRDGRVQGKHRRIPAGSKTKASWEFIEPSAEKELHLFPNPACNAVFILYFCT
jgi:hypothetical protein